MSFTFALAGNQNSGKTTLFNQLTGSNQHVGNWPGVTVEQKTGTMIHHHHGKQTHIGLPSLRRHTSDEQNLPQEYTDVKIVDLPGIYSLSPIRWRRLSAATISCRISRMWSSTVWTPPVWSAPLPDAAIAELGRPHGGGAEHDGRGAQPGGRH